MAPCSLPGKLGSRCPLPTSLGCKVPAPVRPSLATARRGAPPPPPPSPHLNALWHVPYHLFLVRALIYDLLSLCTAGLGRGNSFSTSPGQARAQGPVHISGTNDCLCFRRLAECTWLLSWGSAGKALWGQCPPPPPRASLWDGGQPGPHQSPTPSTRPTLYVESKLSSTFLE